MNKTIRRAFGGPGLLCTVAMILGTAVGAAQDKGEEKPKTPADSKLTLDEIMVKATRFRGYNTEGTRKAREMNVQVVDALGPSDIKALPSQNLDEVLKRIPGMQVSYDFGEAAGVVARGSNFVQTTIDGDEIATAGFRNLSLGDVPSDLVQGVDVFKTQSANQIEGGIGATIEVHTKQPFDFDPNAPASILLMGSRDAQSGEWKPDGTLAVGYSWDTSIGKLGASLGLNRQEVEIESALSLMGTYTSYDSIVDRDQDGVFPGDADDAIIAPSALQLLDAHPRRKRTLGIVNLQWAPSDSLEFRASHMRNRYYDSLQFDLVAFITPAVNDAANADDFTTNSGGNILNSASFSDVPASVSETISIWRRDVKQTSVGAKWAGDRLSIDVAGNFADSFSDQKIGILGFGVVAPMPDYSYSMNGSERLATVDFSGLDLLDPANFNLAFNLQIFPYKTSDSDSGRLDIQYELNAAGIKYLQLGFREAKRSVVSDQALGVAGLSGPISDVPELFRVGFRGEWLAPDPNQMADFAEVRELLDLGDAPEYSSASHYELTERTSAYYARLMYDSAIGEMGIDGDVGVRYVDTRTVGDAFANLDGVFVPIRNTASDGVALPMATLRLRPSDQWNLRFAAAKRLGRPSFDDLNPSLTLNSTTGTASGGNPALKAFTATNLDFAVDWFISRSAYTTFGIFSQNVHGLPQRLDQLETFEGQEFVVSRPYNGRKGEVRGAEVAYNQKFTSLPGRWAGFGFDTNYSYADTEQKSLVTGETIQFENISKDTANLNVFYDLDPILARVGVSYRSPFVVTSNSPGAIDEPQWRGTHVFLDASAQYRIGNLTLLANVTNITQPIEPFYVGTTDSPVNIGRMSTRVQLGARYDFRRRQ